MAGNGRHLVGTTLVRSLSNPGHHRRSLVAAYAAWKDERARKVGNLIALKDNAV